MKKTTKCLSAFLALILTLSSFSALTTAAEENDTETDTKIYFEAPDWLGELMWNRDHTQAAVYCHIYNVYGGSPLKSYIFGTKSERCEWEHDNVFSFDTTRLGTIEEGADYSVVFHAQYKKDGETVFYYTYESTMGIQCLGDTMYPTDITLQCAVDTEYKYTLAKWKDPKNNDLFGPMITINSLGHLTSPFTFSESKFPLNMPKAILIADRLYDRAFNMKVNARFFTTERLNELENELGVTALEVFDQYIICYSSLVDEGTASGELADIYDENTGEPVKLIPTLERVAERLGLKYGDADNDSCITISDATEIQKNCAELVELSPGQAELADFDRNKTLDISDATEIQFKLADLI
ncbi:MAG: hypothetical protein U0L58_08820 [Ruminococcus sp.]|nr:hypothetical protein [Ruminococcus sp.]